MQNATSRTAGHVALFRALESARRRDKVFDDPYASKFLPPRYRMLARLARIPAVRRRVERYIDTRFPAGPRASAVVRTRLIDDLVGEALAAGIEQVLLLGAGYDSRAYRLPAMASARVFEVDHPATQASKRRRIRAHVRPAQRAHVRFVPVDLMRDDLSDALRRAGFATDERAVVVWEGVTNYLTAAAVDTTLAVVRELAGPGSRLVLTYVDRRALAEPSPFPEARRWVHGVAKAGEPWTFGLLPDEAGSFFGGRGFRIRADVSSYDAGHVWFAERGRRENGSRLYRIAVVEVVGSSAPR